jgi:hypothetical protein
LHFAVECDGLQCRVRDLGSSNGTFVNGSRVTEQLVNHGDSLAAGESTFAIHLEESAGVQSHPVPGRGGTATTPMFNPPMPGSAQAGAARTATVVLPGGKALATSVPGAWPGFTRGQSVLLNTLFPQPPSGTVYAVLDAMRDSRIPAFLDASGERYLALDPAARVQVFVVAPAPHGRLLDVLIKDGWGRGWGYFCVSSFAIEEICAHLRNYMMLFTGAGRPLTMRFWDPRVLRVLAPALPQGEAADFFGPVARIVVEGEKPEVALELSLTPRGPRQQTLMLV